jgi:hypothetical protein
MAGSEIIVRTDAIVSRAAARASSAAGTYRHFPSPLRERDIGVLRTPFSV